MSCEQAEKLALNTGYRKQVLVCGGTGCTSSHSLQVIEQLEKSFAELGIDDVLIVKTGCFGLCALGPIMIVYPEGAFYSQMTRNTPKRSPKAPCKGRADCKELYTQKPYTTTEALFRFRKFPFINTRCA